MVGRTPVWTSRASSPERSTETSVLSSWTEERREQSSGMMVASPSEILSMSVALMIGNRSFGRSEGHSLVLETRSMKALTISSLDGVAITAQKWCEA